jgi:hypothetical protein
LKPDWHAANEDINRREKIRILIISFYFLLPIICLYFFINIHAIRNVYYVKIQYPIRAIIISSDSILLTFLLFFNQTTSHA